jgi:indolepyruvate ferredoxin oxidoreductase beta subunit
VRASHILAEAAINAGNSARVGETFGAAMRGGKVHSHIRIGDVHGPLVREHSADIIVAQEPLEGLRIGQKYAGPAGVVILNPTPVYPVDVSTGNAEYPSVEKIEEILRGLAKTVAVVDGTKIAGDLNNSRSMNIVMLGAAYGTGLITFDRQILLDVIAAAFKPKFKEVNEQAFLAGEKAYRDAIS